MRHLVLVTAMFLAGCATAPQPPASTPQPVPVRPQPQVRSDLVGLSAAELVQRFGAPALQVREGAGLKLQFRGARCVLDAYLYLAPTGGGIERVTHVDTRVRSGADVSQASCIASFASP